MGFRRALPILGELFVGAVWVLGTIWAFLIAWGMVALLIGILFFGLQIPS